MLAFLLAEPAYGLGADMVAGLFGVIGVAGVVAAPLAGRMADRRGARPVVLLVGALLVVLAWICSSCGSLWPGWRAGHLAGSGEVQSAPIAHQRIYGLRPERGRINTLFMTGMFLGNARLGPAWDAGLATGSLAQWEQLAWGRAGPGGLSLAALGRGGGDCNRPS